MLKIKTFTEDDWLAYSGCESKHPCIGIIKTEIGIHEIIFDLSIEITIMKLDGETESFIIKDSAPYVSYLFENKMKQDEFENVLLSLDTEVL